MSGAFPSQPFPNDYESKQPSTSSFPSDSKQFQSQTHLFPIDEADDFYDPFSDLSLFLANKVKKEIQSSGSPKKWSGRIEANLLSKILPEFKKQFPKYRLGATALKKVWEKVSYYYEKVTQQKGAINQEGTLNLPLMIRENVKQEQEPPTSLQLPPYHRAYRIAVKISECIATLEGKRPDLDHLTKMIWAIQKNTLKNLSSTAAKSPYEEYDLIDKLVVKTTLEQCGKGKGSELKALKANVFKRLEAYGLVYSLTKNSQLTSTLSMLLAKSLSVTSAFSVRLSIPENKAMHHFIEMHLGFSEQNPALTIDTHCNELVQRLLALYPVVASLPKNLSEEELKNAVQSILHQDDSLPMESSLYVFISAEMHLMSNDKTFSDPETLFSRILTVYHLSSKLPPLPDDLKDLFELLIWKTLSHEKKLLSDIPSETQHLLMEELGNFLIDQPTQSFRKVIQTALQFFKKIQKLPFHQKDAHPFWLKVKKKVEIWTLQNEMLCRWIHFDHRHPFYQMLKDEWTEELTEEELLRELKEKILKAFPRFLPFQEELTMRLWILYHYYWYVEGASGTESSYERFLKKHHHKLKKKETKDTPEMLQAKLMRLSNERLPLTPFEEIAL